MSDELNREEIEYCEQKEEEYWQARLHNGTYPCDYCGEFGFVRVCINCESESE